MIVLTLQADASLERRPPKIEGELKHFIFRGKELIASKYSKETISHISCIVSSSLFGVVFMSAVNVCGQSDVHVDSSPERIESVSWLKRLDTEG